MEYLLLFAYGAIFAALVVYVLHLRSRLTELEDRLEDVSAERRRLEVESDAGDESERQLEDLSSEYEPNSND